MVVGVGFDDEVAAGDLLDETEGASADRVGDELGRTARAAQVELAEHVGGDDRQVVGEGREEGREGLAEGEAHGVVVKCLDRVEGDECGAPT